jgi:XTP/dITP diphosphohydrolase
VGDLRAVLASSNENKLRELEHALDGWTLVSLGADDYPPETGETYLENARAKAEFGRTRAPDRWILGEDSGVEIEGLGLGPGVLSARWAAGREAERALEELQGVHGESRRARYVCELVALSPEGVEYQGTGVLTGRIGHVARGIEGFGFDPVFIPEGEERTVAELGNSWKRDHSHRARAARALLEAISSSTK